MVEHNAFWFCKTSKKLGTLFAFLLILFTTYYDVQLMSRVLFFLVFTDWKNSYLQYFGCKSRYNVQ